MKTLCTVCAALAILGLSYCEVTGALPEHPEPSKIHRALKSISSVTPLFCTDDEHTFAVMDLAVRGRYDELRTMRIRFATEGSCVFLSTMPGKGMRSVTFGVMSLAESVPVRFEFVETVAIVGAINKNIVISMNGTIVCWRSEEEQRCL